MPQASQTNLQRTHAVSCQVSSRSVTLDCLIKSEHQFQPKLNLAGTRGRARDLARRGTDAIARKDEEVRNAEVRLVCDVKAFGPEQQLRAFRDWDGLEDREVNLRQARPIQHSAAHTSPGSQRGKGEGFRVEPLLRPAGYHTSVKVWIVVGT